MHPRDRLRIHNGAIALSLASQLADNRAIAISILFLIPRLDPHTAILSLTKGQSQACIVAKYHKPV